MKFNEVKLWTALITPMKENGDVDYKTLDKLVDDQVAAKNGILVLGSTGEALNLSENEKKNIFEYISAKNLPVPLMAGVGGINLNDTLSNLTFLETLNYDCYLMVTPLYAKPGPEGQFQWFKKLMDAVTKPVMLYNIPGRTGVPLAFEAVDKLLNHPNFWSIKEASGSPEEFKKYVDTITPNPVFSGDDGMLPTYAKIGAKGLVSVASNAWPQQTNSYVEKCLEGTLTNPESWAQWSDTLFLASNPIPVKKLLFERGELSSPVCRAPLTHMELSEMGPVMKANDEVLNWN